ncbi:MAG: hypothetical protein ACOWWM_18685 [Desulfobacterales bacterium]
MDFIGHFQIIQKSETEEDGGFGNFTMVVSADSTDGAAYKFREEILRLKAETDVFDETEMVFLEDIVQIMKMPEQAVLTRIDYFDDKGDGHISGSLYSDDPNLELFGWDEGDGEGEEEDVEEEFEIEPFIDFTEPGEDEPS